MTTIEQLSQSISNLGDALKQTQALITRLSKLSFQPGSEPLDPDSGSVRLELAQDIHDSLKQLDEDLELLRAEVDDLNTAGASRRGDGGSRERDRDRLGVGVARLGEDLAHARTAFRRAQLSAKRASEAAKVEERQLLFKGLTSPAQASSADPSTADLFSARAGQRRQPRAQQQLNKDEVLVNATSDVTAALRRTHDLLSTELSRSRFAQETFDQSTAALHDLGDKYADLDSVLAHSRNLLSTLLRSQKSDTWFLETAFYLLAATLAWLVFRRLLFGPFVRLPLFLWTVCSFLLRWVILKPLLLLLTLVGVIRTEPLARSPAAAPSLSASRAPLIIQPSANDPIPHYPMADPSRKGMGVPAGAGGAGAKVGKDPALEGKMSEKIAEMAEGSARKARGQTTEQEEADTAPVRRGDGTILQERGDVPKNPKKKTFDAGVEGQNARDEL